MSKLFVDLFDTGIKELTSLDSSMATHFNLRYNLNKVNQVHSLGLPDTELAQPIKPRMFDKKVKKIQPILPMPKLEKPIKVSLLYDPQEKQETIRALVRERMPTTKPKIETIEQEPTHTKIFYDLEPELPEEAFKLPAGSLDEFKTKFDTHIKKLKSIEFKIPTQLKEIYLDLVEKLENILNYIESVAVGLFAEFVEYIGRFIQWLTGPTQRTAEDILIEIKDVTETVELVENVIKK